MNSMTLYVERNSIVHKMDPITKMIYVIVSIAVTYILPVHLFVVIVTSITLLLLILGKVFRKILPIIGVSILLIISIIIVFGIFHIYIFTDFFYIVSISFSMEV